MSLQAYQAHLTQRFSQRDAQDAEQWLAIAVNNTVVRVDAATVALVAQRPQITRLPGVPPVVAGVCHASGRSVVALHLSIALGHDAADPGCAHLICLAEGSMALLATAVAADTRDLTTFDPLPFVREALAAMPPPRSHIP